MPRPTTKQELITAANSQFDKLFSLIDAMPKHEQTAEFCFDAATAGKEAHWERDKNIRDVLVHLYEWHQLLLNWVKSNQNGDGKPFLPEPYNWKTYGEMNVNLWEKHQSTPYERSREITQEEGFEFIVFMNEASRYVVAANRPNKEKSISDILFETLRGALLADNVNPAVIDRYIAECGEAMWKISRKIPTQNW
jgi:hypothetical protein